jgi:hypothetical protein
MIEAGNITFIGGKRQVDSIAKRAKPLQEGGCRRGETTPQRKKHDSHIITTTERGVLFDRSRMY